MRTTQSMRARALRAGLMLPVLAGSLLAYSAAMAQSTGSQTVEEVVVVGKKQITLGGALTAVETPKAKSIITQEYIATQPTGQNVIQDLNLVPGVSYTNDDPFGMSGGGGHLRIRGIDGSRISLLVDGVPLNDTGNYAIYPGELLDPEIISQTNVNIGSTDVDSPTASAVGGLININSLTPTDTFGGFIDGSYGSYTYRRIAGLVNTGTFGPWGTKAWVEGSDQQYDKYKGFGQFTKWQLNGKIYQPLWHEGDFIAVAGFYDIQRQPNIYGLNQPTLSKTTGAVVPGDAWNLDYLGTYYSAGATPGVAGSDSSPVIAGAVGGVTVPGSAIGNLGGYYFGNQVNPTDTWNIRAESKFTILPNLHLTIDPAFQSVLADGGTQASTISESDPRLIGNATTFATCKTGTVTKGVDLNGDGDCMDTVRVFQPSLTHTERITVNASAIWDITADHLIRVAYAYDHGHHRQIGEFGFLNADGTPQSVFGGFSGNPVLAADGSALRRRDRLSIAVLNQFSGEYVGHFFDQKLRVDLGVRNPHFDRDLNQFCYTSGVNGSGVYCDSAVPPNSGSTAQYNPTAATSPGVAPFKAQVHYSKVLPNVGLSWRFDAANMVYFSYSQQFSAPRTDDLYTVKSVAGSVSLDTVTPETSTTYEGGYRYQTGHILGSVAVWDSEFHNRIVSTYDPVTGISDDRNVGNVQLYGVDAQFGARPIEHMTALATFSYVHSKLEQDLIYSAAGVTDPTQREPLAGKQLVETPQITFGGRITYNLGDLALGFQGKYTGSRFTTDVNDQKVPGYTVFDLDVRYKLDSFTKSTFVKGSYIQLNVTNLFNKKYFGSLGTTATYDQRLPYAAGTPYAYQGGPRTIAVSLKAAF